MLAETPAAGGGPPPLVEPALLVEALPLPPADLRRPPVPTILRGDLVGRVGLPGILPLVTPHSFNRIYSEIQLSVIHLDNGT